MREDGRVALTHRLATHGDLVQLAPLVQRAIDELQAGFLTAEQIQASHDVMGIDTQLIDDGTYYVIEVDGHLAGCGGWSRRATLYGSDHSAGRDAHLLDPETDAARIRAMYTHPDFVRRGVGRRILEVCEEAAAAEGFRKLSLMGTMAGQPLYLAYGFEIVVDVDIGGTVSIPAAQMVKVIG
jgi:GNAT superfamily N-acetyltransferase